MVVAVFGGSVGLRDARGQVGRIKLWVSGVEGTGTLADYLATMNTAITAAAALSNGAIVSYGGLAYSAAGNQVLNPDQYGVNQAYPNAEDKAVLVFLMQNNTLMRVSIPEPIGTGADNIFYPDGETVKLTATNVAAFEAAMTADATHGEAMSSKNGSQVNILVAGYRQRRRFQRKTTIWTLDPTETIPEE